MTFKDHIIEMLPLERKKELSEVRANLNSSQLKIKIENYIQRFDGIFTYDEIISQIETNDLVASFFIKNPLRQNFCEKECAKWIGVKKLPSKGKNCIRFNEEGEIVNQKTVSSSKSADFLIEGIYFTQKYTGENTGGAQDNQFNDVVDFLTKGSIYYKVGAIVDGAYWEDMGNKEKLIENFQKNPNVIILSADDIKEGKIKNEY